MLKLALFLFLLGSGSFPFGKLFNSVSSVSSHEARLISLESLSVNSLSGFVLELSVLELDLVFTKLLEYFKK